MHCDHQADALISKHFALSRLAVVSRSARQVDTAAHNDAFPSNTDHAAGRARNKCNLIDERVATRGRGYLDCDDSGSKRGGLVHSWTLERHSFNDDVAAVERAKRPMLKAPQRKRCRRFSGCKRAEHDDEELLS